MGSSAINFSDTSESTTKWKMNFINIGTAFMNRVPDYGKVTNLTFSMSWKASISVGNTCKVYLNDTVVASDSTSGTSKRTVSANNLQKYCASETADAGYVTNAYVVCDAPSYRKYTLSGIVWTIYWDDPIFTVTANVNNSDYGYTSFSNGNSATVGNTVTVTATANAGYKFVQWSDGDTEPTKNITVNQDEISAYNTQKTYTAIFEPIVEKKIVIKEAFMLKNDNEKITKDSPIIAGQGLIIKVSAAIE
jgi:hypothetical protein